MQITKTQLTSYKDSYGAEVPLCVSLGVYLSASLLETDVYKCVFQCSTGNLDYLARFHGG